MAIVPDSSCPAALAETIHGLTWQHIFRLRDAVARTFYGKFAEAIPLEEFLSEGNQVLAESLTTFDPHGPASFTTYLYRQLQRRLWDVPKRVWHDTNETTYASHTQHAKRLQTTYKAPQHVPLPDDATLHQATGLPARMPAPLTSPAPQESFTYLQECLAFVTQRLSDREQTYLWHSLDGDDCAAIGRHYRRHKSNVQRALHQVRQRLTTWAETAGDAAADAGSCVAGECQLS